jgi:hypothetical protein
MPAQLHHAVVLLTHGLLTELPAQLVTAAVAAAAATSLRTWRRRSRGGSLQQAKDND